MGKDSKIEWTHHTFNPWVGCTKVSPACDRCYAEAWSKRTGSPELWQGERRRTTPANWKEPRKWNAAAKAAGVRERVFCASLADVFDNQVPEQWREDLWDLIFDTESLDWLLLTKRPQNIRKMLPKEWHRGGPWSNVWLGTTTENQEEYQRRYVEHLSLVPCVVQFISYEPALGPLALGLDAPDWVICGGESGSREARPMHPGWARAVRDECAKIGIPFLFKQWGEWRGPMDGEFYNTLRGRAGKPPAFIMEANGNVHCTAFVAGMDDPKVVMRVGKVRAGRLLDGVEHNGFPVIEQQKKVAPASAGAVCPHNPCACQDAGITSGAATCDFVGHDAALDDAWAMFNRER